MANKRDGETSNTVPNDKEEADNGGVTMVNEGNEEVLEIGRAGYGADNAKADGGEPTNKGEIDDELNIDVDLKSEILSQARTDGLVVTV